LTLEDQKNTATLMEICCEYEIPEMLSLTSYLCRRHGRSRGIDRLNLSRVFKHSKLNHGLFFLYWVFFLHFFHILYFEDKKNYTLTVFMLYYICQSNSLCCDMFILYCICQSNSFCCNMVKICPEIALKKNVKCGFIWNI
jgi:hypothetical protein